MHLDGHRKANIEKAKKKAEEKRKAEVTEV
jgi:hypothetical protein